MFSSEILELCKRANVLSTSHCVPLRYANQYSFISNLSVRLSLCEIRLVFFFNLRFGRPRAFLDLETKNRELQFPEYFAAYLQTQPQRPLQAAQSPLWSLFIKIMHATSTISGTPVFIALQMAIFRFSKALFTELHILWYHKAPKTRILNVAQVLE